MSGRRGIRVNAIAPGYFASEMTADVPRTFPTKYCCRSSARTVPGTTRSAARTRRRRRVPRQPCLVLHHGHHARRGRWHVRTLTLRNREVLFVEIEFRG